jgi:hypothetical protein
MAPRAFVALLVPCPGCRPTPPAGPGATIDPIPAISVGYRSERSWFYAPGRPQAADTGASCAGRSKLVRVGVAATLPCGQVDRRPRRRGNVSMARPKPAGNKLSLRAGGIGQNEGGGRVVYGATRRWRRGNGERPPYPARGGWLGRVQAATGAPGHSSCVFLLDPVKYI